MAVAESRLVELVASLNSVQKDEAMQSALTIAAIFQGETTTTSGRVYAQVDLADSDLSDEMRMEGTIRGPFNQYATTLPSTIPLQAVASNEGFTASAIVPDPCTWTTDLPSTYEVALRLMRGNEEVASSTYMFGFRKFGVVGNSFLHEGKRWVFRGASVGDSLPADADGIQPWRESRMACVVSNPTDEFLRLASEFGLMVMAEYDSGDINLVQERLRALTAWPAVVAAKTVLSVEELDRRRLGGLMFSSSQGDGDFSLAVVDELPEDCAKPVIVSDNVEAGAVAELRRACEKLQGKMAPREFAGFVVRVGG